MCSTCAIAQQKHLPKQVTITLTSQEVMRLDSAVNFASNTIDSKHASQWFQLAFAPFYQQITKQLVVDSVKVASKKKLTNPNK